MRHRDLRKWAKEQAEFTAVGAVVQALASRSLTFAWLWFLAPTGPEMVNSWQTRLPDNSLSNLVITQHPPPQSGFPPPAVQELAHDISLEGLSELFLSFFNQSPPTTPVPLLFLALSSQVTQTNTPVCFL